VPSIKLNGSVGFPTFPSWLGKNSKQRRVDRILQEIEKHMRTKISANREGLNRDYLPVIRERLTKPLIKDGAQGVDKVIDFMDEYYITREDFDSILELTTWTGQADVMSKIDSKVKAAFTRTYNKKSHKNPFVAIDFKKLKGKAQDDEELLLDDEEGGGAIDVDEGDDKDDVEKDTMIKAVRKNQSKSAVSSATKKTTAAKPAASKRAAPGEGTKVPASKKKKT
jgi:replication factor C subunit 1